MTTHRVPPCPKCRGTMEEGLTADRAQGNEFNFSVWSKGPPQFDFWMRIKLTDPRAVITYRCNKCGYLESYANEKAHDFWRRHAQPTQTR